MALEKILESDLAGKGVLGQPDVPGLSAEKMQEKVEEIVRSVAIVKINEIIEYLLENGATKTDLEDIVLAAGAVTSVHGRRGNVVSETGDYTPEQVGAAPEKHAEQHNLGGSDPLDLSAAGISGVDHVHGNIDSEGKIGSQNGKILMTGIGGTIEAKEKEESGLVPKPILVATSGTVSMTVEDNREYEYTGVTNLVMVGAEVKCHGFVNFGSSAPSISVTGFAKSGGDDVAGAKALEIWEFSCDNGYIIWKNWSA
ncbi:MAG: hypothetical protein IKL18_06240 [Oscillospiraceae bacterium]|nr:hypothetical protein [Oscillospiraceae bacterium]MBR6657749.1 hypothetical protein [Oscillospiraceae bacterium]